MSHQAKPSTTRRPGGTPWAALTALGILLSPVAALAGEGGTAHVVPGAMATLVDGVPASGPGSFVKPVYMHYDGSVTALIPTAAGLAGNADVSTNTFGLIAGHTFGTEVLGGATWTMAAALPYIWLDITADLEARNGATRRVHSTVDGFGDLTIIPAMLGWKSGDWQFNAILPIYAPTGSYEKGRLGNTGLNYWTFDPTVGVAYSNADSGFNALLNAGLAINTENDATDYHSGNLLHFDGAVQQIVPAGSGFLTLGAEGFYFQQVSCDSGAGATLGCFKGKTAGLGPVLGYIQPFSKTESLLLELKWLNEMDTERRLNGDYIWLKAVYKF